MSKTKKNYRIRNWPDYNKALVKRGSLTVWFDEKMLKQWHQVEPTGKRGRPRSYSDTAIECALSLRALFRLSLRSTQGFVESLVTLLHLPVDVPDYTVLGRRQKGLSIQLPKRVPTGPLHMVVDSSGIKVYGEGEWHVKMHGKSKRRTWRKLHIAVDAHTHDIRVAEVTGPYQHDSTSLPVLLAKETHSLSKVSADGAYDTHACYQAVLDKQASPNFPPREHAALHWPSDEAWRLRNHAVMQVRYKGSKKWKEKTNYHQRSLAETAFFRLKKLFGQHANNKRFDHQITELLLRCKLLNRINQLGMPDTVTC